MVRPFIKLTYGELLHLYRYKNGYNIKHVAKYLKVTSDTIKNYESSKTFPSYYEIKRLEKLYNEGFKRLS